MADNIPGASSQATDSAGPKLEVTRGENTGETFKVHFETTIGRELDNDVVLLDARASRHHAKILLDNGQWQVIDLNSANGTQVNGVTVSSPVTLKTGDRVTLGETELLFQMPGSTEAGPPPAPIVTPPAANPTPGVRPAIAIAKKRPRLAWIASGIILFVCFAAVLVLYVASSRLAGEEPVAAGSGAPSSETGQNSGSRTEAPGASNAAPEDLTLVYEDDFSDSFGGWDDAFDQYTRKVYGNNRYQIEVQASNLVAWGLANRDVADFELEVEAKLEDGDQKNSYGILFRFLDRENFYRFDVSGDGYYLFSKFIDGEWSTLVDWTQSQFINTGGAANILKVSAFGPEIALWANGQQLATLTDGSLPHGNFGFFAGTFAEPYAWVSYDNLKLWAPANTALTLIPTATRSSVPIAMAAAAASPTPLPPTSTPSPELVREEVESPVATPGSDTAQPGTNEPTPTPVPLPEYASRDQTLARGEAPAAGRIVFPLFDSERGTYDIYSANISDGSGLRLVQSGASQPALSEDGVDFAYRSWAPDRRGLFARKLTAKDDSDSWRFDPYFESAGPQFSPLDQSLIYFSRSAGREPAVYRIIDGEGLVMRREGAPIQGKSPKWSPNGQQFVYSSCLGGTCGIMLSSIDGANPTLLTNHPSDTKPEISPDGSMVVFMSERAGNWEIYRVDLDGKNLKALTTDSASDGLPTWSPEGSKIAFVSNRDGAWAIWDMNPDGSNKRRHFALDGSPDGVVAIDPTNSFGWVEENIDWIP
jgi:hypothetical protein